MTRIIEEFWHFTSRENGAILGVLCARLDVLWLAGGATPKYLDK